MKKQNKRNIKSNRKKLSAKITNQTNSNPTQYINSFGAYYKDDTLDGFSFGVMGYENSKMWSDIIKKMTDTELKSLEKNGETFNAEECFKHLEDSIKYWNLHTIGSVRRKERHCIADVNLNDDNIRNATLCIIQDIHILTKLGYIKNDNYNGMSYGYSSDKCETNLYI